MNVTALDTKHQNKKKDDKTFHKKDTLNIGLLLKIKTKSIVTLYVCKTLDQEHP